jgi:hypothetical protein
LFRRWDALSIRAPLRERAPHPRVPSSCPKPARWQFGNESISIDSTGLECVPRGTTATCVAFHCALTCLGSKQCLDCSLHQLQAIKENRSVRVIGSGHSFNNLTEPAFGDPFLPVVQEGRIIRGPGC